MGFVFELTSSWAGPMNRSLPMKTSSTRDSLELKSVSV
jgi:hypothetical protein